MNRLRLMSLFAVLGLPLWTGAQCPSSGWPPGGASVVAVGHVTGSAYTNEIFSVPVTYERGSEYGTDVCDALVRVEFDVNELGFASQDGPWHTRVGSTLDPNCAVGSMRYHMGNGRGAISIQVSCPSTSPIGTLEEFASLRIATWEETDPGVYPLTITHSALGDCNEQVIDPQTWRYDGSFTVN